MSRIITRELAERIVKKLKGVDVSRKGSPHDDYKIVHEGKIVAFTSIRRGSSKDQGHDFMSKNLEVNTRFAYELGICTKSRDEFLVKRGVIAATPKLQELGSGQFLIEGTAGSEADEGAARPPEEEPQGP
jgi:hypothetical protein